MRRVGVGQDALPEKLPRALREGRKEVERAFALGPVGAALRRARAGLKDGRPPWGLADNLGYVACRWRKGVDHGDRVARVGRRRQAVAQRHAVGRVQVARGECFQRAAIQADHDGHVGQKQARIVHANAPRPDFDRVA